MKPLRDILLAVLTVLIVVGLSGCGWRGLNSLPMPGTRGGGEGSFQVQAQLPNVSNIQQNSRVRVADVEVGTVTKIERQGWHALVTMKLDENVRLPANATAKIGQTSLLGSLHIELAPPTLVPPEGRLHNGSLIPLSSGGAYPSTEQTLAAVSLLLNGGGIGRLQDITRELSVAFSGREQDLRGVIGQLNQFFTLLDEQTGDIITASESLNRLVGQFADQKPVLDGALRTLPDALAVLKQERDNLADTIDRLGQLSALTASSVDQTKQALVAELRSLAVVLDSLANSGTALTRSLDGIVTFPWPRQNLPKWVRGDYANLSAIIDLTLSRIDSSLFTGTRWEGNLTQLELQWGRTIGQLPSPATAGNPLVVPYHLDQGP